MNDAINFAAKFNPDEPLSSSGVAAGFLVLSLFKHVRERYEPKDARLLEQPEKLDEVAVRKIARLGTAAAELDAMVKLAMRAKQTGAEKELSKASPG